LESKVLAEPVLVGREQELRELQRYFELAKEGQGTTVFISGEAGSGKTRLMTEFLNFASKREVLIMTGWCLSNAAQPYFPFVEAFESFNSTVDSNLSQQQELKSWFSDNSQAKGREAVPQVWKDQTFAAVTKELLYMSTNKPIILFIDDLHWADSASLALLHYVARSIISERLLVIATFRSEEISHMFKGQPHPLAEALRLMARENLFKELKLQNLNQADVGRIVESMLGGSSDSRFVEKLSRESSGNPLYVVEALRMMYCQGTIKQENGKWCLMNDSVEIPPKVRDIIARRLEALRPSQRRILDVASVIGEKFDPQIVAGVLSQDSINILEALKSVSKSTVLVFNEEDFYRFEHAKIQEMLYEEIPMPLKKEFHCRIAHILENKGQDSVSPFTDIAYHYSKAGIKEKAIEYSLSAGQDALAKWSNVQAIEHFVYVLENVVAQQTEAKKAALEGLGDAYAANGMLGEAIKVFDQLAESADGSLRLRAIRKAMDAAFIKGDKPDLLLDYSKKAEELAVSDRLEMARVLENRGRAFAWAGRGDVSLDLADYEAALHMFEEENSLADLAEALARDGEARLFSEDMQEKALGELLRSAAISKGLGDFRKEIQATLRTAYGFLTSMLFPEARRELAKVLKEGERLGTFVELARAQGMLGLLCESEGKLSEALPHALKALDYCERTDVHYVEALNLLALIRVYSRLGDLKRADDCFDKVAKLPTNVLLTPFVAMWIPISQGVYFAAKEQWEKSNKALEKAAKSGWIGFEGSYAWVLEKQGRVDEAKAYRAKVQKMLKDTQERFNHANIQMNLLMPRVVNFGEEFEMHLDLVNVGRNPGALAKVERLIPSSGKIISMPSFCSAQNGSVLINHKSVSPFQVESFKLRVIFSRVGTFNLNPCLVYINDNGETITRKTRLITIRAQLGTTWEKQESADTILQQKLEFKTQAAEKAFNFLASAFEEDYLSRRFPQESCGWRTLMEVVKNAKVTKYSFYGRCGKDGKAKLELEHLGVAESRFFLGERGRGGRILKMRIRCENEIVRNQIGNQKS
jgi:tetratricopeptide (TPR) repeat protein